MARPKKDASTERRPAKLCVPRHEARQKIEAQRDAGSNLASGAVARTRDEARAFSNDISTWHEVTTHLLRTLFDTDEEADRFSGAVRFSFSMGSEADRLRERREDAQSYVRRLDSLLQRLDLIPEPNSVVPSETATKTSAQSDAVFIVHGHDVAAKQETARLLERLKLQAVILDEQTNQGRTIIEKFEDHAAECSFAVVLLTPDDFGRARDGEEKPRARQNVLFELGYFMARLGRGRVCALHKGGLELPSDIQGVIWISFDDGSWRLALAKEMRDAKMPIDLNLL